MSRLSGPARAGPDSGSAGCLTPRQSVLGIVQGLTEFLPISSTAHLRIVPAFVGWTDPGAAFTAVVQLGTLLAVLIYFRADLPRIVVAWFAGLRDPARRNFDYRMGWYLIIATIPIVIFGAAFSHSIEKGARDLFLIGSTLIALGFVLLLADRIGSKRRALREHPAEGRRDRRARPGPRADPGRLALRRDHLRRACFAG